ARLRAVGEKNGFLHFGFSIFAFRLLAIQGISNSAHSCQKRVPAVKSIPLFWLTRPSACCGAERNVVLSTINELSRANSRSPKRPPTHSDNAFRIHSRGKAGRASIVALTVTLRSSFKTSAQTRARELVAWTCDTF